MHFIVGTPQSIANDLRAGRINLTNVNEIAIGLGNKANMASAGGSGTIYIDDIRLYRP